MTKAITRTINGTEVSFLAGVASYAVSIDGFVFGAGSDRMEALAEFRAILSRVGAK